MNVPKHPVRQDAIPAPHADRCDHGEHDHFVQFYEEDVFLLDQVGRWLAAGIEAGEGCVVLATKAHRDGLEQRLSARGVQLSHLREHGQYVALDAADTLSKVMTGRLPDARLFDPTIGGVIAAVESRFPRVRAFGELVALLCQDEDHAAALGLERMWNELSKRHRFSLLCGYPLAAVAEEAHGQAFLDLCAEHTHTLPAESYAALATEEERMRTIARLQQKARSLETEVRRRRAIEQSLRSRERELADFLENAAEGLHQVGPDGRIVWANKAELELIGYAPEEYVGHSITEFHVDREVIDGILERLLRGETLYDQSARLRCRDGSTKHVLIHSNSLWNDGRLVHTRCFTRDVTDRVRLEQELRERVEQLADRDRRKDEFLATLGHELRNPLSAIAAGLEVLRQERDQATPSSDVLEILERQTRQMTRLIEDLLDVSRITRGKVELREDSVSLAGIVAGAVESVQPLIDERRHTLVLELPREPVRLRADPARLEQALANLLHNAAKFSATGGRIVVGARCDGADLEISVRDNGVGLSPAAREKIFDLFAQDSAPSARAGGGLGIGLTLVRSLVELHGGTVVALSDGPGRGSEFVVRLLRRVELVPAADTPSSQMPARNPRDRLSGRNILIVDDNSDVARTLAGLVRGLGHVVRVVNDGEAAIQEARRSRPDLVILDIGLPGMDGYEVARRLRTEVGLSSTPLVALTGFGRQCDRERAHEAGFDHHIVKPVDAGVLAQLLESAS